MRNIITYITLLPAVLALLMIGCKSQNEHKRREPTAIPVTTVIVRQNTTARLHSYTGELVASDRITLHFPLGGELKEVNVRVGEKVKEGQQIAVIDNTREKALHDAAVAVLRQAEDAYDRLQQVHEKGVVSDVKWVEMQTDLEKARQNEIATAKNMEDCRLLAKKSGTIASVDVSAGQTLLPGQTVATMLGTDHLEAVFSVPEQDMPLLYDGAEVTITIGATGSCVRGRIRGKGVSADRLTHTYPMRAETESSTAKELYPGMVCVVSLSAGNEVVFVLPQHCIQTTTSGHAVWLVQDGKAMRQEVEVSGFIAEGVRVTDGLKEGDIVITEGHHKLYNGAPVIISEN